MEHSAEQELFVRLYSRDEDRVDPRIVLEVLDDLNSFAVRRSPADVRSAKTRVEDTEQQQRNSLLQFLRVFLQGERDVREDDDLVVASFVITNEKLTGPELVRIHHAQQQTKMFVLGRGNVLLEEIRSHLTPDLVETIVSWMDEREGGRGTSAHCTLAI